MNPVLNTASRLSAKLIDVLVWMSVFVFFLWAVGAIYYLLFLPIWIRTILAVGYAIATPYFIWRADNRSTARAWVVASVIGIFSATQFIHPSNDRIWDPDHSRVAKTSIENGIVTIQNFRNCTYRSEADYDVNFEKNSN